MKLEGIIKNIAMKKNVLLLLRFHAEISLFQRKIIDKIYHELNMFLEKLYKLCSIIVENLLDSFHQLFYPRYY